MTIQQAMSNRIRRVRLPHDPASQRAIRAATPQYILMAELVADDEDRYVTYRGPITNELA